MNDDLISRAAAIDALRNINAIVSPISDDVLLIDKAEAQTELMMLPSVQPEIIRCKDCKWCENADGSMCKNPASWVVATDRDFGCVLAERRTDESDK